jgi:inosine-uridine nucleoside N-ribohydrolase
MQKVIIDVDPGIDDSYALSVASLNEDIEIMAITVVHGNTSVDNGAINTKIVLDNIFPKHKPQPPIYLGAQKPLYKPENKFFFYNKDGLAGLHETLYKNEADHLKETFLKEKKSNHSPHAANKIVELVNQYPNEITIIALAPLTNLALALKLCHEPEKFTKNIKKILIMGGNEPKDFFNETTHDTSSNYPEFNFRIDSTAAKIVLEEYLCPISIVTFDSSLRAFEIETSILIEEFKKYVHKSKRCNFLQSIGIVHRLACKNPTKFFSCDLAAVLCFLHSNECKAEFKKLSNYTVQSDESNLDGLLVERNESKEKVLNKNIDICTTMDSQINYELFKSYLEKMKKLDENEDNFI